MSKPSIRAMASKVEEKRSDKFDAARLLTSGEFVRGFVPPDPLVDGVLMRRCLYSMTAPTGHGKTAVSLRLAAHVALGLPIGGRTVKKGQVIYLVGENPDDVTARWIVLCQELKVDPAKIDVRFLRGTEADITDPEIQQFWANDQCAGEETGLVLIDTSAAYFRGKDENDNVEAGAHARKLRMLTKLPGGPTVIVLTHPTKTPNMENLQPRGGGSYIAEVDGGLVVRMTDKVVELHWQVKLRGADFAPLAFELKPRALKYRNAEDQECDFWTVIAEPIDAERQEELAGRANVDHDRLLAQMLAQPSLSMQELAKRLGPGWSKPKVQRALKALAIEKLVKMGRGRPVRTHPGRGQGRRGAAAADQGAGRPADISGVWIP